MITAEQVRELLDYDPATGHLIWRSNRSSRAMKGAVAGCVDKYSGYRVIVIAGKNYKAAHLVWLHQTGEAHKLELDHIDRCRSNNRIENLRDVSTSVNQASRSTWSAAGFAGVHQKPDGRFAAQIRLEHGVVTLGTFDTAEDAHEAFQRAHIERYGADSQYHPDNAVSRVNAKLRAGAAALLEILQAKVRP